MPSAAIIGAGPAGCVAALLLARASWDVTLIEQHRFPRDKVCGECLSPLGVDVLRRLDLIESLQSLNPIVLTRTTVYTASGSPIKIELPRPMLGISRRCFDLLLLNAARAAGAIVHQPARCERLERNGDARVWIRNLDTNESRSFSFDWVLLADGKASLMSSRPPATDAFGIKAHFDRVEAARDSIELFAGLEWYGGVAAIEHDRWNAAFSVPRRLVTQHIRLNALFTQMMSQHAGLKRALCRARQLSNWLAAPLPRFAVTNHWPTRVIPLGNAAAAIEPIGGEGMGLAMRSAELAATELVRSHQTGRSPNRLALREQFSRLWSFRSVSCRALAVAFSSPLSNAFVGAARVTPSSLHRLVLRATGK